MILAGVTGGGYVSGEAGADSLVFNVAVGGVNSSTMATILGGTGADTLDFNATILYASVLGGSDTLGLIDVEGVVTSSTSEVEPSTTQLTLLSHSADHLLMVVLVLTSSPSLRVLLAPVFWLAPVMTPFTSVMAIGIATTTYYFGKTDGKDTLSFATTTAGTNLVIAVDASYGATSGVTYSGDLDGTWYELAEPSPSLMPKLVLLLELCSSITSPVRSMLLVQV